MNAVTQMLIDARALVATPEQWLGGGSEPYAQNVNGEDCSPFDEGACRFCVSGAFHRADHVSNGRFIGSATQHAARAMFEKSIGGYGIALWNDSPRRTHDDVLLAFDKALAPEQSP